LARPREFDEEEVLTAIKDVFWQNGFEGTSYADLISASRLHKGSLYAAFGDKHALYLRALQTYDKNEVEGAVALLTNSDETFSINGRDRVNSLLTAVIDAVSKHKDRRGCLLCNAAVDQAPHSKAVEKEVSNGLIRMQRAFEETITDEPNTVRRKEKANLINATYFGMRVMAKSGAPVTMMKQAREGLLRAL